MMGKVSPCLTCKRVRDPENCENKNCKQWQQWFVARWELLRQYPRRKKEKAELEPLGVPLGGEHYASPHRVREYLGADPCESCVCPSQLCRVPCRIKQSWEEAKGEAL